MSNPRKFSEKIALHNQKQAEETAAFEKIMREVSDATSKPDENTLIQFGLGSQNILNDITAQKSINSQNATPYRESRERSVGIGPMRRPADRKIDTSPYSSGSTAYLSPPSDWRRTSSDSAIHQSLQQNQDNHHSHGSHSPIPNSPIAQRRIMNTSSIIDIKSYPNEHGNNFVFNPNDGRPRSSCGLPRPPGINIYHSAHDNTVQIPIGNNTGSLPDLTSVHFPPPLPTPLDQEQDHSSSPYSSGCSPTSIPTRHPTARFPYSPVNSPGEAGAVSPTHGTSQHFLSVPGSKYLQNVKGSTTDNNSYQTQSGQSSYINQQNQQSTQQQQQQQQQQHQQQQQQQQQTQQNQLYNQRNQHSPPNNVLHGSQGNLTALNQSNLSGYRSPGRPSPGSSPGLVAMPNSDSSAPCSPASQPLGNNGQFDQFQSGEYYLNPSIQQHFEQFSLYDEGNFMPVSNLDSMQSNQMPIPSSLGLSNPNINLNSTTLANDTFNHANQSNQQHLQQPLHSPTSQQSGHHQTQQQSQHVSNTISNTQHHSQMTQNSQPQQCPQTPNTPTSIPEIIFSDCSGDLTKDLFDDQLRPIELELGAMDFAGFQILSDPNATMIADPTIEDSFRQDLN